VAPKLHPAECGVAVFGSRCAGTAAAIAAATSGAKTRLIEAGSI